MKKGQKTSTFSTIAMSIHLEAKTAYLVLTLVKGGARVCATGCNPLSTQGIRIDSLSNPQQEYLMSW